MFSSYRPLNFDHIHLLVLSREPFLRLSPKRHQRFRRPRSDKKIAFSLETPRRKRDFGMVRKFVVAKVERKFYVDVFLVDKVSWTGNLGLGKGCVAV